MTLTEFLLQRIAEDEAAARAAGSATFGLISHRGGRLGWSDLAEIPVRRLAEFDDADSASFEHIARHDPARVLAKCEADRRIVEFLRPDPAMPVDSGRFVAAGVLTLLALPYAEHEDFQEDWRP